MKRRRRLCMVAIAVALGVALGLVFHPELLQRESIHPLDGEAVMAGISRYLTAAKGRGEALPEYVSLGRLVELGYLKDLDLGSSMAREYSFPARGLVEGTAPFLMIHFPHDR